MPRVSMVIQVIPPFRGKKSTTPNESKPLESSPPTQPLSPTSAQKLNVNATSFRPNPKAVAFTPVTVRVSFCVILISLLKFSYRPSERPINPESSEGYSQSSSNNTLFVSDVTLFRHHPHPLLPTRSSDPKLSKRDHLSTSKMILTRLNMLR